MLLKQWRAWLIISEEEGEDGFTEAITFELGREGLIKFQEVGGGKKNFLKGKYSRKQEISCMKSQAGEV